MAGLWMERCDCYQPFGKYDPRHNKPVPEQRCNIVPLAVTEVNNAEHFGKGVNMELLVWLAETPQGLWGVDAGLYFLSVAVNGEGNIFMKMK